MLLVLALVSLWGILLAGELHFGLPFNEQLWLLLLRRRLALALLLVLERMVLHVCAILILSPLLAGVRLLSVLLSLQVVEDVVFPARDGELVFF